MRHLGVIARYGMFPFGVVVTSLGCGEQREDITVSTDVVCSTEQNSGVTVGGAEGAEPWFAFIRDGVVLPSGGFTVADSRRVQLFYFEPDGTLRATVGGSGAGPGEFRLISSLAAKGDSVIVGDGVLRRTSVFDKNGQYLRDEEGLPPVVGPLADGTYIEGSNITRNARGTDPQLFRDTAEFVVRDSDANLIRSLGKFPLNDQYSDMSASFIIASVPFGRRSTYTAAGGHLLVATAEDSLIAFLAPSGDTARVIRIPEMAVELSEDMKRAAIDENERLDNLASVYSPPSRTPSYGRVHVGQDSTIWVEQPDVPGHNESRFVVLSWDGDQIEDLRFAGLNVSWLDANRNGLLVRLEDSMGVHSVRYYTRSCDASSRQ